MMVSKARRIAARQGVITLAAVMALAVSTLAGQQAGARSASAVIRSAPAPGVRLLSGRTICDEALIEGHWVNRYWTTTGQIKPDDQIDGSVHPDAFRLAIEGQDLAGTWTWVGGTQRQTPHGLEATVELSSTARPITVRVHTLLTGRSVMVRWLEIANTGPKATAITAISPWAGLVWRANASVERLRPGQAAFEVATTKYMDVGDEGSWEFDTLGAGTKTIGSNVGVSGLGHPTFFARNRLTGEWAVASLGWSSNWTMQLTGGEQFVFSLGPSTTDPVLRVVDVGETVKSPETHLLVTRGDLDHVIQTLHEHVRSNVLPPAVAGREYQVEANHRGYLIGREDEPGLKREVDLAAAVGAEMFVVDAGWFGPRRGWGLGHGEWYPGPWLPNDLHPVRAHARKKGLLFGLWAEIETVGPDARVGQQHPDWLATRDGKQVEGALLDLSNPEAAAWAESEIARLIQRYDLDMFRLDYNLYVGQGGSRRYQGFVENTEWRHVQAIYDMFDRLRRRFPRVIFQNCANGGGRLDYGMMRYFQNAELGESMRPPHGLKSLNGVTWVLPPEILLRTLGTENDNDPAGSLESDGDIDLQLRQIMMARPIFRGISPTLAELDPLFRETLSGAMTLFKRTVRPIMVNSLVYHHTPITQRKQPVPWIVLEYATRAGDRAVAALFRTAQEGDSVYRFLPRGLDFSRNYHVHFGNSGQVVAMSGAALRQEGIPIRLEQMLTSEMLIFEAK